MRPRSLLLLLPLCGLLDACAGTLPQIDSSGSAQGGRQELRATLESLKAARQAGRTGTVTGYLYLLHPGLPTILRDHPVTLLPASPALEASVTALQQQFSRHREPLSPADLTQARRLIDEAGEAVAALGHADLIQTVTTDTKEAAFTFSAVPEGRWLLLAEFDTPLSLLLWASPVTVQAGQSTPLRLNDETIWLEGLKP